MAQCPAPSIYRLFVPENEAQDIMTCSLEEFSDAYVPTPLPGTLVHMRCVTDGGTEELKLLA